MKRKYLSNNSEARMTTGLELLEKGAKIAESNDGSFAVPSLTRGIVYDVRLIESISIENRCKNKYCLNISLFTN